MVPNAGSSTMAVIFTMSSQTSEPRFEEKTVKGHLRATHSQSILRIAQFDQSTYCNHKIVTINVEFNSELRMSESDCASDPDMRSSNTTENRVLSSGKLIALQLWNGYCQSSSSDYSL